MSGEPVDYAPPQWSGEQRKAATIFQPDIERYGKNNEFGFDDASIRAGFVRKVFAIVTIMCLICILMVTPVVVNTELRELMIKNSWIYLLALLVFTNRYDHEMKAAKMSVVVEQPTARKIRGPGE
ncbi:hypothetical protein COOONC_26660 [Cooperia oncophora]